MPESVHKVLFLTGDLRFRGSSVLLLRLVAAIQRQGLSASVICTERGNLDSELCDGIKLQEITGYLRPLWGHVVRRTVLHRLRADQPQVIHVFGRSMLREGLWLGRMLNCPVVVTVTNQSDAARGFSGSVMRGIAAIHCVSESVRRALPASLQSIPQRVIAPGVPLSTLEQQTTLLAEEKTPVLGIAGPLEVIKGGSFFLRACHRVIEEGHAIRIVIVGSGPEERNLRRLATSLSLDSQVTFIDGRTALYSWMSAIDIFCLPSLQQGFGVLLLEAMALARPVIASSVGGVLDLLEHESTGLVVPPSNTRELADALLTLLNSPETARGIAIAGQNHVEDKFTAERMASDIVAVYNEFSASDDSATEPNGQQVVTAS